MLSETLNKAFNEQIKNEFFSAYLYMQMGAELDKMGLKALSAYYLNKVKEEGEHAWTILRYIMARGGTVDLLAIPEPSHGYASAQQILEITLTHEQGVTKMIDDLAALAESENDRATRSFLNQFIDEQVEEESTASDLLQIAALAPPGMMFPVEMRVAHMMKGK
jgi:ferritin